LAPRSTLATVGNIYEYESEPIKSHVLDMVEIVYSSRSNSGTSTAVQVAAAEDEETGANSCQEQLTRPLNSPTR
jgi:hypothetical protein